MGFYELPDIAIEYGKGPENYCAVILPKSIPANNTSCGSRVQWMYDRKKKLNNFSLRELVIPGTHHSAAFAKSEYESLSDQSLTSRWTLTQVSLNVMTNNDFNAFVVTPFHRMLLTKSIKSQLIDGIRYLDLRPSVIFNGRAKKYMVTHNVITLITMDEVVKQINEFMEISKDIVIVSLKEFFEGFDFDEDHRNFIKYLERSFARHAHLRQIWRYPLRYIWANDRRLIISYDHHTYNSSNFMWPHIRQYWSDAQTINRLYTYFNKLHNSVISNDAPYATMVELTHSFTTITQDLFQRDMSLRHWGERIGKYIPRWYTEEWNKTANIIAVDFYQASGVVDLAIHLNEERSKHPH